MSHTPAIKKHSYECAHVQCVQWGQALCLCVYHFILTTLHTACTVLSCFSLAWLSATLWTIDHQAPLSMGFSRQEYWSGVPCPPPEDLPYPGIKSTSLTSPALAGGFFSTSTTWEAHIRLTTDKKISLEQNNEKTQEFNV